MPVDDHPQLPRRALKGTYALLFKLESSLTLDVGRLGRITLPAGKLVYVGSALGSGGLRARLRRHLSSGKRPHWHIDALTDRISPTAWVADDSGRRLECDWVQKLMAGPGASVPAPGFGSTDCRRGCRAHLMALPAEVELDLATMLGATLVGESGESGHGSFEP